MEKILNLVEEYFERNGRIKELKRKMVNTDKIIFGLDGKVYFSFNDKKRKRLENMLEEENTKLEIIRHKLYLLEKYLDKLNEEIVPGRDYD